MTISVNLNADMGEGFGAYDIGNDDAILKIIRSASIACGFHAGDPVTMQRVVERAKAEGLAHGQHLPLSRAICPFDCTANQPLVQVRDDAGNLAGVIRCLQPPQDLSDPASPAVWKAEKWLS